jgi:hypothetical protein
LNCKQPLAKNPLLWRGFFADKFRLVGGALRASRSGD